MGMAPNPPSANYFDMIDGQPIKVPIKRFSPVGALVCLWVHPRKKKTIELPDGMPDPYQTPTATVISCGPDCKYVKEGDLIMINPGVTAVILHHGGDTYHLLKEEAFVVAKFDVPGHEIEVPKADEGVDPERN